MKPLFGIDCTENKKNEVLNLEQFLVQKTTSAMEETLQSTVTEAEEYLEQSKLPAVLRGAQWLCGAGTLLVATGILKALAKFDGPSIAQAYENAGYLFWIAGGCLVVWAILKLMSIRKMKALDEHEETSVLVSKSEGIQQAIYRELGVPANAPDVDVLVCRYKVKDGNVKYCNFAMTSTPYMHGSFKLFGGETELIFADLDGKYSIPRSALRQIRRIDKRIGVIGWNKDQEFRDEPYAQYKIKENNGVILYKPYYELSFRHDEEDWTILFPCYELDAFESATGLRAVVD